MLVRFGMLKFVYEAQLPGTCSHIVDKLRAGKVSGCGASESPLPGVNYPELSATTIVSGAVGG
jgi:hypothetical protein